MTKYHLIGIGGIGMSGLARLLSEKNFGVSGSDAKEGETVRDLKKMGIKVALGHDSINVPEEAHVVYSTDISQNNPELLHAKAFHLPTLHRSDLLHLLMKDSKPLLVTGTHGKTTTSSLLASVLLEGGANPSYALGGILNSSQVNAAKGAGTYFVAEADESDGSFLRYHPYGAIITNIDLDHMDYYKTEETLINSFIKFGSGVISSDHLFYCVENERIRGCNFEGVGYGFTHDAELKGSSFHQNEWGITFDAEFDQVKYLAIEIPLIGYYNALNALAVFGLALRLGIPDADIRKAFLNFKGVKRRAELKGESHGIQVRDDYGHHPTEIKATLRALKDGAPDRRLVVLFQPHRYSRTKNCLESFGYVFDDADEVFITDIFASQELQDPSIHAEHVVQEIRRCSNVPVRYIPKDKLLNEVAEFVRPLDHVVTMGAGDIWQTGEQLLERIETVPPKKFNLGLVFGGKSEEHDISLKSAINVAQGLNRDYFDLSYFYISKKGTWFKTDRIELPKEITESSNRLSPDILRELNACEVIFPVLHGPNGEDGTLQGFFDMLCIPYAGCNHQASAVCMDKAVTKKLAMSVGIKTASFIDFSFYEWRNEPESLLKKIQTNLSFPLYVKPVHLGSAIGVERVNGKDELIQAVDRSFLRDEHVIIEEEICGRELEFAVLGGRRIRVFPPGEILRGDAVYDFEAKYGLNSFQTVIKAHIDSDLVYEGVKLAKLAYAAVGGDGFARVDFFLDENNQFFLNEINPIPGFTQISLYPKMCEAGGVYLTELLTELVGIALSRQRLRGRFS